MTHAGPMPESAGTFGAAETNLYDCVKCGKQEAECRQWDSSCGGYTDYKYTCRACGHVRWVEGPDA